MSNLSTARALPSERIKAQFFADGDGLAAVARRSAMADAAVLENFQEVLPDAQRSGLALLAVGGYGRSQMFPCSDVDLLFLCATEKDCRKHEAAVSRILTGLWDCGLRVSHSVRTPQECARLARDNAELHISLLDTRFLGGAQDLYESFSRGELPRFFAREKTELLRNLLGLARARHGRHGDTIYHLEPNVKEAPGGLRDFQLACWLLQLTHVTGEAVPAGEEHLRGEAREVLLEAKRFLFAVRCYLHYFHGRDNNNLTFDLQEVIAKEGAGKCFAPAEDPAEWMRDYFRNARIIHRLAGRLMEAATPPEPSLFTIYRDWLSRLSNSRFVVARGKLFLRNSRILVLQPEVAFDLFAFVSRHGVPLAMETEKRVQQALETFNAGAPSPRWPVVADILRFPHAYQALTAMHESGALFALFPEFEVIDSLVVRDFYHRYTVDEHTFVAIRVLHELAPESGPRSAEFHGLLTELERPERLYFALLFHDLGKGKQQPDHTLSSVEFAAQAMARIEMDEEDREFVRFLIRHHLDMSQIITGRDLSDPETAEQFAGVVRTIERLKALTLLTYADTSAVNPQAMTPWRAELLWQLYIATHNCLMREAGDRRIHVEPSEPVLEMASTADEKAALSAFLEGFPEGYLRTRAPEQVYSHFQLSRQLATEKAAVHLGRRQSLVEVVVVSWDRPFLFASLCATLSSFGLNIEKGEAFANEKGMVLDTFVLSDPRRTLELNPHEAPRLISALNRIAEDPARASLPQPRRLERSRIPRRLWIEPRVSFDNETSSRATIFHVTAQDRTGLLYDLSSKFSQHECDIQVVLIDTQGHKAIDVFYVVGPRGKLDVPTSERLRDELLEVCREREK